MSQKIYSIIGGALFIVVSACASTIDDLNKSTIIKHPGFNLVQPSVLNQYRLGFNDQCGYFALFNAAKSLDIFYKHGAVSSINNSALFKNSYNTWRTALKGAGLGTSSDLQGYELQHLLECDINLKEYHKNSKIINLFDIYLIAQPGYNDIMNVARLMQIHDQIEAFKKADHDCISFIMSKAGHYYSMTAVKDMKHTRLFVFDSENNSNLVTRESAIIDLIARSCTSSKSFATLYIEFMLNALINDYTKTQNKIEWVEIILGQFKASTLESLKAFQHVVAFDKPDRYLAWIDTFKKECTLDTLNLKPKTKQSRDVERARVCRLNRYSSIDSLRSILESYSISVPHSF